MKLQKDEYKEILSILGIALIIIIIYPFAWVFSKLFQE